MIVVFDGLCNFCNSWTRFVLRRDRRRLFRFAAAQSQKGSQLLRAFGLPTDKLESIVLIDGQHAYEKSDAVLRILRQLDHLAIVAQVLALAPKRLRDASYSAFARRRYRWFGRVDHCPVPDAKWHDRFIS